VTEPLVSRLTRIVKNALETGNQESDDGDAHPNGYHKRGRKRSKTSPEREVPFVRPVERLAAWPGFNVEVVVSGVMPSSALILYRACDTLANRCRLVQERLAASYPELIQAQTPLRLQAEGKPDSAPGNP
jgi:hypothetical protein